MGSTGNFLRTIDDGIKSKLSGAVINGTAVPVHYAFPETEFVSTQYPSFTLQRYSLGRAAHRKHNYKHNAGRNWYYTDINRSAIATVRHPEPYDVFYQIDTHAKYREHDVELQEYLLRVFDTYGYLSYLMQYSGKVETVAMVLIETLTLDSSGEDGIRFFRKTYRYRVEGWFEFAKDVNDSDTITDIDLHLWDYTDGIVKWTGGTTTSGFAFIIG